MRIHLPDYVIKAIAQLEKKGHEAFVVGGCVRDSLLNKPAYDYDLATSALPEETRAAFLGYSTIDTGLTHGTLTVMMDRHPLEITTYRTDGTYSDARHPDQVTFVRSIKEDLARRDFTVNALAYHPKTGLYDPFGGKKDLHLGLLRAVGEPQKRFTEDALRILRGLRFACQLGFALEEKTYSAMMAEKDRLEMVAEERIAREINLSLLGPFASTALSRYPGLLTHVLPELGEEKSPETISGTFLYPFLEEDLPLRWAALFLGAGAKPAELALRRLKQPRALIENTALLLTHFNTKLTKEGLRPLISSLGYESTGRLLSLRAAQHSLAGEEEAAQIIQELLREKNALQAAGLDLTLGGLAITGHDLMALGFPEGQVIGQILKALLMKTLTGQIPNEKEALEKQAINWKEEGRF